MIAQAVLRIEGANIFPFTANSLNIFVSALVDLLPNVTASDIVIGQVLVKGHIKSPEYAGYFVQMRAIGLIDMLL